VIMTNRFVEHSGGDIRDTVTGILIVNVNVTKLSTEDAGRVVKAVINGLEIEFGGTLHHSTIAERRP